MDILVLLAVHPEGLHRDRILEAIWPDIRRASAVARLHTTVSSLRAATTAITAAPIIVRAAARYQINAAAIDVDLWRLHRHATTARRSPPPQAAAHWRAILTLTTPDQTAQPPAPPNTGRKPGTDPAARQPRAANSAAGFVPALAAGMVWPWLHPHRRSLHATVVEARSHVLTTPY